MLSYFDSQFIIFTYVLNLLTYVTLITMTAIQLLEFYLKNPGRFSVLVLGERGIGKTKSVKEKCTEKLTTANCASFSDDTMAESELFGHKKGSFTGASEDKIGLFDAANNGALFLDEVHTLSPRVQEKLMTALQTEGKEPNNGKFLIRRLGENKPRYVLVRPIFASNLKLPELKRKLLPDLYDRISQLVVELPSIHESKLIVHEEFKAVWAGMKFKQHNITPGLKPFIDWINKIPLEGNYRTLQNIAIYWHQERIMLGSGKEEEVFEFVKTYFLKFHSPISAVGPNAVYNFRRGVSKKQLEKEYQKALYDWAISDEGYGSTGQAQKGLSHSRLKNPHL